MSPRSASTRPKIMTSAPQRASWSAMARPIPVDRELHRGATMRSATAMPRRRCCWNERCVLQAMDAIDLLKEQHREVESLFKQIESTADTEEKVELVQDLANSFAAHATIEERIFYPAAYRESTKEVLDEAVEEHLSA